MKKILLILTTFFAVQGYAQIVDWPAAAAALNRQNWPYLRSVLADSLFRSHYADSAALAGALSPVGCDGCWHFTLDGRLFISDNANWNSISGAGVGSGDLWSDPVNADIVPDADGTRDLGATATRFDKTYTDTLDVTTNIVVGGTVDGRDVSVDGTKLDGIESGATADQTAKNSIEIDTDEFQLVGDAASPGINQVYGTNGAGVKGWKADPAGGSGATKLNELSDVDTVGVVEGSFYQYNNNDKEWQPISGSEARAKIEGRSNGATTDTFVLADELVRNTNAALTTTTVPLNSSVAFTVGHTILVYSENNDTKFVKETAGVDLISPDTTAAGEYVLLQGDFGFLYKSGTDEWILSGLSGQDGWQPEQSISFENAWAQTATRTTATYRLAVLGGRPFLQFYGMITAASVTGGQFMTLPAAFRPDFTQVITTNTGDSNVFTTFTVATGGGVSMGTTSDQDYRLPTELIPLF